MAQLLIIALQGSVIVSVTAFAAYDEGPKMIFPVFFVMIIVTWAVTAFLSSLCGRIAIWLRPRPLPHVGQAGSEGDRSGDARLLTGKRAKDVDRLGVKQDIRKLR
jgi:hypothetical protein